MGVVSYRELSTVRVEHATDSHRSRFGIEKRFESFDLLLLCRDDLNQHCKTAISGALPMTGSTFQFFTNLVIRHLKPPLSESPYRPPTQRSSTEPNKPKTLQRIHPN
jgi:hypothetical protein